NTNSINTVSTPVSTDGPSFTNDDPSSPVSAAEASNAFEEHLFERFSPFKNAFTLLPVSNVTPMDDTIIFGNAYDDEDVGVEADINNLETTMNVSPIPTTRINKDHPKDQIIGDFNLAIQTRRMTKITDEHAMSVPTHYNDPLLSGEDRLKLTDLMDMCTKLSERVLDLEHTKTAQAQEITNLKLRVKKLEKKIGLRTHKFKRLYKGRSIDNIDKDAEASLVDETQGRSDDAEMFDTDALIGNEVFVENDMIEKDQDVIPKEVSTAAPSTTVVPPPDIT
ncbi:hypothetical protein Tco_0663289, partial [Tanacetum coccineum]